MNLGYGNTENPKGYNPTRCEVDSVEIAWICLVYTEPLYQQPRLSAPVPTHSAALDPPTLDPQTLNPNP